MHIRITGSCYLCILQGLLIIYRSPAVFDRTPAERAQFVCSMCRRGTSICASRTQYGARNSHKTAKAQSTKARSYPSYTMRPSEMV